MEGVRQWRFLILYGLFSLFCREFGFGVFGKLCVNPNEEEEGSADTPCLCGLDVETVTKGKSNIPVCIAIDGNVTSTVTNLTATQTKTHFFPKIDEFTDLEIAQSNEFYVNPPVKIQIEIAGAVSDQILYKSEKDDLVVPMFTAVAIADNGVVKAIVWDDGCFDCECEGCKCLTNEGSTASFCAVPKSECGEDLNCDLQIFLGWKGTDDGSSFLTSEGMRFSRFRKYSVSGFYTDISADAAKTASDIADLGADIAEIISDTADQVEDAIPT